MVSSMTLIHAFEMLENPPEKFADAMAVFGNDSTLRSWVFQLLSNDGDVTQFDGEQVEWSDLRDELATASLFDFGGKRTILLRNADKFVSNWRPQIEKHLAKSTTASRFVLELDSLASNTRVYKALLKQHALVDCRIEDGKKGSIPSIAKRRSFLMGYVAKRHSTKLTRDAADVLMDMVGDDIGILETEIAKLALYCEPKQSIDQALVEDVVAGWQGKTVWQITDAIVEGDAAEALRHLDKLLGGGPPPIALLPQIAWSLRRLGMATSVYEHYERSGSNSQLEDAISCAGFNRGPSDIQKAKQQLSRMGRDTARQLLPWLLDADLRLKGTHSNDGRDRFLLENLVIRLAKDATQKKTPVKLPSATV
jgi:DNA polymerase-3 subunit delta